MAGSEPTIAEITRRIQEELNDLEGSGTPTAPADDNNNYADAAAARSVSVGDAMRREEERSVASGGGGPGLGVPAAADESHGSYAGVVSSRSASVQSNQDTTHPREPHSTKPMAAYSPLPSSTAVATSSAPTDFGLGASGAVPTPTRSTPKPDPSPKRSSKRSGAAHNSYGEQVHISTTGGASDGLRGLSDLSNLARDVLSNVDAGESGISHEELMNESRFATTGGTSTLAPPSDDLSAAMARSPIPRSSSAPRRSGASPARRAGATNVVGQPGDATTLLATRMATTPVTNLGTANKQLLREAQDEVIELRKALLTASNAVHESQQQLRMEKQRSAVLENERDRAVKGLKELVHQLQRKEAEIASEFKARGHTETELRERLAAVTSHCSSVERSNDSLSSELRDAKQLLVETGDKVTDYSHTIARLEQELNVTRTVVKRLQKQEQEVDAFHAKFLKPFVAEAGHFQSHWERMRMFDDDRAHDVLDRSLAAGGTSRAGASPSRSDSSDSHSSDASDSYDQSLSPGGYGGYDARRGGGAAGLYDADGRLSSRDSASAAGSMQRSRGSAAARTENDRDETKTELLLLMARHDAILKKDAAEAKAHKKRMDRSSRR